MDRHPLRIGARIKAARKRRKLTSEQLAERVGVSRGAISQWENDLFVPNLENLVALCNALEVSADHILQGKDPDGASPDVRDLVTRLADLDDKSLEILRQIFGNTPPSPRSK